MDISTHVEVRTESGWNFVNTYLGWEHLAEYPDFPFGWRNYVLFAFLTDSRNSRVKSMPHVGCGYRGLPEDSNWLNEEVADGFYTIQRSQDIENNCNNHGFSWVLLAELLTFDYDQAYAAGQGEPATIREELGAGYFRHLELLTSFGAPDDVRVVYWFN